jgi:hypothetical protein
MIDTLVHEVVFSDNSLEITPSAIIDYEAAEKQAKAEVEKDGLKVVSFDQLEVVRTIGKSTALRYTLTVDKKVEDDKKVVKSG